VLVAMKTPPQAADIHHLHLWSLSNEASIATLHIAAEGVTQPPRR